MKKTGWALFALWAVSYAAAWRLNLQGFPNYEPEGVWPVAASAVSYALLLVPTLLSRRWGGGVWRGVSCAAGGLLLAAALCALFEPLSMLAIFILCLMLGFYGLAYPLGGLLWATLAVCGGLLVFAAWMSRKKAG